MSISTYNNMLRQRAEDDKVFAQQHCPCPVSTGSSLGCAPIPFAQGAGEKYRMRVMLQANRSLPKPPAPKRPAPVQTVVMSIDTFLSFIGTK